MAHALMVTACPHCANEVRIDQRWTSGGVNDSGGWILKCGECGALFEHFLGQDINDSRVSSGATVVTTYDVEVESRESVMERYGLRAAPDR